MTILSTLNNFYDFHFSEIFEENLKRRLEFGLVQKEAFTNRNNFKLRRSVDSDGDSGSVYEAFGPSFLWESNANTINPVSTLTVDNVPASGTYDYINGRVILDSPVSDSADVRLNYAFPDVSVNRVDQYRHSQLISDYINSFGDNTSDGLGLDLYQTENRLWLPSVMISTQVRDVSPFELGGTRQVEIFVLYKIFSNRSSSANSLKDLLLADYDSRIDFFDPNSNDYQPPYLPSGEINSLAQQYDDLISNPDVHYTTGYVDSCNSGSEYTIPGLFVTEVRQTINAILPSN